MYYKIKFLKHLFTKYFSLLKLASSNNKINLPNNFSFTSKALIFNFKRKVASMLQKSWAKRSLIMIIIVYQILIPTSIRNTQVLSSAQTNHESPIFLKSLISRTYQIKEESFCFYTRIWGERII